MAVEPSARTDLWIGSRDPLRRRELAAGAPPPPLPITEPDEALERALWLHGRGLNAPSISVVMGVYHGIWATGPAWNTRLMVAGAKRRWPPRPDQRRASRAR